MAKRTPLSGHPTIYKGEGRKWPLVLSSCSARRLRSDRGVGQSYHEAPTAPNMSIMVEFKACSLWFDACYSRV